jgi:hypothetical protein
MLDIAMEVPKSSEQPYYLFAAIKPLPPGTNPRDVFAALAEEDADRDWQPPAPSGSLVIQTILDTEHFWILVPLEVGGG